MTNLLAILAVAFLGYAFWQQSKQTEVAKKAIARHCKQLNLQLLSVARGEHKLRLPNGQVGWYTIYLFEFSATGEDCYQGQLIVKGLRSMKFILPPHHMPVSESEKVIY